MTMQIVIYGDNTYWLFTGTAPTRMLAIAAAVKRADQFVGDFTIKTAYEPLH